MWLGWLQFGLLGCVGVVLGGGCGRDLEPPTVPTQALDPALQGLIHAARQGVLESPNSAGAWGRLGETLDAAEYDQAACLCYERAAALDPRSVRWHHLLGVRELARDPKMAVGHLTQAAVLAGVTNDASRLRLAQALVEQGRLGEAAFHLERWLQQQPDHPAARLELARVRCAANQWDAAEALLSPCLTNAYTARSALRLLSQVRARAGNEVEATELARRAAAMPRPFDWPDPFVQAVQGLRIDRATLADRANALMAQHRFPEADLVISNLLGQLPNDPEALLLSGRSLLQQRKCAEAEERLRAHLAGAPNSLNGWIQLALALLCQQRWEDASQTLERALTLKPDFAQAHANLGLARARLGDASGAIRSYRDALRCSPGDAPTHVALAEQLARIGDSAEALQHSDRALALDPGNSRARALRDRLAPP